jgi:hypothetical protein
MSTSKWPRRGGSLPVSPTRFRPKARLTSINARVTCQEPQTPDRGRISAKPACRSVGADNKVSSAERAVKSWDDVCRPATKLGGADRIQRPAGPVQRLHRLARVLALAVGSAWQRARVAASSLTQERSGAVPKWRPLEPSLALDAGHGTVTTIHPGFPFALIDGGGRAGAPRSVEPSFTRAPEAKAHGDTRTPSLARPRTSQMRASDARQT